MAILHGVYHEIPERSNCKNCNKVTNPTCLEDYTVEGKFVVFIAVCRKCNAVNWHYAGDDAYVGQFRNLMSAPDFKRSLFTKLQFKR